MSKYNAFYCDLARLGLEISDRTDDAELGAWLRRVHRAVVMEVSGVEAYADFIMASVDNERADWRLQNYRTKAAKVLKAQGNKKPTPGQIDALVSEMYPELEFVAREDSVPATDPIEPELMPARPVASRTAVRVADPVVRETFEVFRKAYRGQKNGLESELQVFLKACAKFGYNPAEEVGRLLPAWDSENRARVAAGLDGAFFPQVKNLKTWLGNACWLQDLPAADPVKNLTQGERIILKNRLKEGTNA